MFWCSPQIVIKVMIHYDSLWSKMTIQNDKATRVSFGTLGQGPRQVKSLQEKLDEKVRLEHQLKETGPWRPWRPWESGKRGLSVKGNPWKLTTRGGHVDVCRLLTLLTIHFGWWCQFSPIAISPSEFPFWMVFHVYISLKSWQFAVLISIHSTSLAKNILRPNYSQ